MILPPLPKNPCKPWTEVEQEAILAWGKLCVKTVCGGTHPRKFSDGQANHVRFLVMQGQGYKQVYKHYPMSEKTFYNIVNKQGAYK